MPIISLLNITKSYKEKGQRIDALRGINLDIYPSEFISIVGPSGSGKSSLLNIIAGIDSPDNGVLKYKGFDISHASPSVLAEYRQNVIGYVFQKFNLFNYLNVLLNVNLVRKLLGKKAADFDALNLMYDLGLERKANQKVANLSYGQRQRAAIARALVNDPEIILADEPTGNLDADNSKKIITLFKKLNQVKGVTVIVVTHNEEVAKAADRIVYLKDGLVDRIEIINENPHHLTYTKRSISRRSKLSILNMVLLIWHIMISQKKKLFVTIGGAIMGMAVITCIFLILVIYPTQLDPQIRSAQDIHIMRISTFAQNLYGYPMTTDSKALVNGSRLIDWLSLKDISQIQGISQVYPVIHYRAVVNNNGDIFNADMATGYPVELSINQKDLLYSGTYFTSNEENSVIIPEQLAQRIAGLSPMDSVIGRYMHVALTLKGYSKSNNIQITRDLRIIGILNGDAETSPSLLPSDFNNIISSGGLPYYIEADTYVPNINNLASVEQRLSSIGFVSYSEPELFVTFFTFGIASLIGGILILLISIISITTAFFYVVTSTIEDKQKDLAIFYSLGLQLNALRVYIFIEGIILSIISSIIGISLGYLICFVIYQTLNMTTMVTSTGIVAYPSFDFDLIPIPIILVIGLLLITIQSLWIGFRSTRHEKLVEVLKTE